MNAEFRNGWPAVVAGCAAALFAWGFASYGQAVYLAELHRTHGWPTALIGGATSLSFVAGAIVLPFVGRAIDRLGARVVLCGGTILMGSGTIAVSQAVAPWQIYPANLLIGAGWACLGSTAISVTLAEWFTQRRGLALSLSLSGASAGGFAVAPALMTLSRRQGFSSAVPEVVLCLMVVVLPALWFGLRRRNHRAVPSSEKRRGAGVPGRWSVMRDARFWSVAAPFALAMSAQIGIFVFQVSCLLPWLGAGGTSLALVCTSVSAVLGRLALGVVIDRSPQRRVAAATFALQAVAAGLMIGLPVWPAALYLASVLFGLSIGNVILLPSLIVQREFPAASYGVVLGLSTAVAQAAYSTMPAVLGVVHDLTGGYAAVLGICVALHLAASVLIWWGEVSAPALQPQPVASGLDPIRVGSAHAARGTGRVD
jgi:MFS family permease